MYRPSRETELIRYIGIVAALVTDAALVSVMNSGAALLVAREPGRRRPAGDRLSVDMDLSVANLPPHPARPGSAGIEVTDQPHPGCAKLAARFGTAAWRFVNARVGRELRLRGLNARVVVARRRDRETRQEDKPLRTG